MFHPGLFLVKNFKAIFHAHIACKVRQLPEESLGILGFNQVNLKWRNADALETFLEALERLREGE
jgi:hypothetical protein